MKRKFLYAFVCFIFLIQLLIITAQVTPKIRINPAHAYGGTVSDYFDSIEYIPLETTKESLFGDIERLIITDSSFIIIDRDTKSVLFFRRNGKFIAKQKCRNGLFSRIMYHKDAGIVCIYCTDNYGALNPKSGNINDAFLNYSITGKLISDTSILNKINYRTYGMIPIGNDFFLSLKTCTLYATGNVKDTFVSLADIYKGNNFYKSVFESNPKEELLFCSLGGALSSGNYINNNEIFVSKYLSHIVYKVTKDTSFNMFQIILPAERSISLNLGDDVSKKNIDSLRRIIESDLKIVTHISNIHFNAEKLFLKLNARYYPSVESSESAYQYNLIYDTITKKVVSVERLNPDENNYFLPISGRRTVLHGLDYHNGHFFSVISSMQMFKARLLTKEKKPNYPSVLKNYFISENRKSNPVLVKMILKNYY